MEKVGYSSKEIANIVDIAFRLGTYLPFLSACYARIRGNAIESDITTDIVEYGLKKGAEMKTICLAVNYAINGKRLKSQSIKMIDHKK